MAREIRRKDRATTDEEARELLTRGEYGVLSTVGPAGEPYGVPISYTYRDGEIYFHSAREGRKVEHLHPGTPASFCVVGETQVLPEQFGTRYESTIASGEIRELDGDEKKRGLSWLIEKYSLEFRDEGEEYIESAGDEARVFSLHVRELTGKRRR